MKCHCCDCELPEHTADCPVFIMKEIAAAQRRLIDHAKERDIEIYPDPQPSKR